MSSRTSSFRTAKLIADKDVGSVVVRLMMALNDIAMANEGLGEWTATARAPKVGSPDRWQALLWPHADGACV